MSYKQTSAALQQLGLPVLAIFCLALAMQAQTGNEGLNAVFNPAIKASDSYIDATPYFGGSVDLCKAINNANNSIPAGVVGAVIDARGINPGTTQSCANSPFATSPFSNVTILLPRGTIKIAQPWIVPIYTHIIGEGPSVTTLQACTASTCTSAFSGTAMIIMGGDTSTLGCNTASSTGVCFGITVSDLTLDAQSLSIDGVDNANAEEQSFVQRVSMVNIVGTGLKLTADSNCSSLGTSSNSGPYNDLEINVVSTAASCVQVLNLGGSCPQTAHPRGLHGLSCTCTSGSSACTSTSSTGIRLDSGGTSVENVFVNGFHDGIAIGDQANTLGPVASALVFNVTGGSAVTNLVHIYSANAGEISDITTLGLTSSGSTNVTLQDDSTNTTLSNSTNPNVGMYVLGERLGGGDGFTRFTTSTTVPTWFVGPVAPPSSCSSLALGSLYSDTTGAQGASVFACISGQTWSPII